MPELSGKDYLNTLSNNINLIIGDWSDDGHCQTEQVTIKSNFNKVWINRAYKNGCEKLGFDWCQKAATTFEDPYINEECVSILREVFEDNTLLEDGYNNEEYLLTPDSYLDIYLRIVKFGDSSFKYEIVSDTNEQINIGGYGLFQL